MLKLARRKLGLAMTAVTLCLTGCPDDEEATSDAGTTEGVNEVDGGGGEAGTGGSQAGESGGKAGESGSTTGASTVEDYTGVTTDDCKSANPACELFCNMICNNCGDNPGAMNGCGPAKGFAKDAANDNAWCLNCQMGIDAWKDLCISLSEVPAPVAMCEGM